MRTGSLDTQIITPRFWGGLSMPLRHQHTQAEYHPAINQIWIDTVLEPDEREIALIHEGLHALTLCFQTPQLLALQAELVGAKYSLPVAVHFADLVEVACATYFLVYTGLEITPRYLVETNPRRHQLGKELIEIAERTSQKVTRKLTQKEALREALAGLCTLIMQVIPYRKELGPVILRMIRSIQPPEDWENQWQVFGYFYSQLQRMRLASPKKLKQFDLNLIPDAHRDLLDMCASLARAICNLSARPLAITALFPTLVMLMTMRSFRFVPTVYLHTSSLSTIASIHVDHVTRRSLKDTRKAVSEHRKILAQSEEVNQPCYAARMFITIAEQTKPFVISDAKDRSVSCFKSVLEAVPDLLRGLLDANRICPRCAAIRSISLLPWAYNVISTMPKKIKTQLIKAAGNYEDWLNTGAMETMRDAWRLRETPKAVTRYRFL